jgi:hypothetical protein
VRSPSPPQLPIIILISLLFGVLGFSYSFLGLLDYHQVIRPLEVFRILTVQEVGGHFIFGFIVGLPSKNLRVALLTGLMALTIDADHFLNIAGFHIQGRIDHSIPFAISSAIIVGVAASCINNTKILRFNRNKTILSLGYRSKHEEDNNKANSIFKNDIFLQFLVITVAAFLSHIAYDVFVDNNARFPLFAPFSFTQYLIPQIFALPIELVGMFMIYAFYTHLKQHSYQSL